MNEEGFFSLSTARAFLVDCSLDPPRTLKNLGEDRDFLKQIFALLCQCSTLTLARLPGASKMIQWASKTMVKVAGSGKQMFCSSPQCVQQEIKRIKNSLPSIYLLC